MGIGGMVAQASPYGQEQDLGDFLVDLYAPQAVAVLIVFLIVFVLVKVVPNRKAKDAKPQKPIPDWYPDPWNEPYQRWWNGASWTAAVRPYPWPGPPGPGAAQGPPAPGSQAPPDLPPGPSTGPPGR